ncbi:MAG: hypothetical protein RI883_783 [Bacteroidota bacterium]|jgi:hypothetical protein
MERISIFNYEAFYLDFLEGNLSEEDAALLLAFLEENPHLKVEEEELPIFGFENASLDSSFKANLKQCVFNETPITCDNADQFLIAETEDLLSSAKKSELERFVSKHPELIQTQKIYAASHLIADKSIVFTDKDSLKQSKKIVLWPFISLAVAASVAILFFLWNSTTNGITDNGTSISKHKEIKKVPNQKNEQNSNLPNNKIQKTESDSYVPVFENTSDDLNVATVIPEKKTPIIIKGLIPRHARELKGAVYSNDIVENEIAHTITPPVVEKNSDYAILGFKEMNNPISPITNRLANVVKQEVDFRTAKATSKRSGGFYLKIGKLEISRRTSK